MTSWWSVQKSLFLYIFTVLSTKLLIGDYVNRAFQRMMLYQWLDGKQFWVHYHLNNKKALVECQPLLSESACFNIWHFTIESLLNLSNQTKIYAQIKAFVELEPKILKTFEIVKYVSCWSSLTSSWSVTLIQCISQRAPSMKKVDSPVNYIMEVNFTSHREKPNS